MSASSKKSETSKSTQSASPRLTAQAPSPRLTAQAPSPHRIDWRLKTICDSLPMSRDLALIAAGYAQHTEVEKLILAFDDQESLGRTVIEIPITSKYFLEPLIISWSRHQNGSRLSRDGRQYTFSILVWGLRRYKLFATVDMILTSDIHWLDNLGDKYKKIGAAYQEFMADAMARY